MLNNLLTIILIVADLHVLYMAKLGCIGTQIFHKNK